MNGSGYVIADSDTEIEVGLEVQPGLRGDTKIATQWQGSAGVDRAVAVNNGVDAIWRDLQISCELVDANRVRFLVAVSLPGAEGVVHAGAVSFRYLDQTEALLFAALLHLLCRTDWSPLLCGRTGLPRGILYLAGCSLQGLCFCLFGASRDRGG